MIPKIIHYCWFGRGEMPELAQQCIASWHRYMPDWQYRLWNEDNFDIQDSPIYVQEAYAAHKYAFVSDYVRLWALEHEGGLYMDVDFEVLKPFDDLMNHYEAFAGYEGSKRQPVMMGVIAGQAHGRWVSTMLKTYDTRHFLLSDGKYDLTPNTSYFSDYMRQEGLITDGVEKDFMGLHIYPVDYFCPLLTSGENVQSGRTYCAHRGLNSWNTVGNWKTRVLRHVSPWMRTRIITLKRKLLG